MPAHFKFACADCGRVSAALPASAFQCPHCGSEWLEARYDYATLGPHWPGLVALRSKDIWRYKELLPLENADNAVRLGEGGTPLVTAANLGLMLGRPNLFIKDERQGPTGSFKDRQAALAVSVMKENGLTQAVVASTGNVAISYAAYCARAGIKLYAFLTSLVPPEKMRECALYGAQVIKVTATYDRAKELAAQFATQRGMYFDRGLRSIAAVESMKTIAYETAEQLARRIGTKPTPTGQTPWRAPDWYIQAVSGGLGPVGAMKGFSELKAMGLIDKVPALAVIQAEGCAPMVTAFKRNLDQPEVVTNPRTHIATLATGNPGRGYALLRAGLRAHGGTMESVSDEEAYRAVHVMAKMEGISMEPAAGVAFAGLIKLARAGVIGAEDVVVVNCSGHTFPIQNEILGEGWARDVELPEPAAEPSPTPVLAAQPHEGLLAALQRLDERVRSIVIVDDNPDAARLIRRILQAKGSYDIQQAGDGRAGLALIHAQHPDLVVLDLMMPEMDGFAVLDALRADDATADIPVIVVTAKLLTPAERERLNGQIEALLQKGSFMDDELLADVLGALT
ncbi:MAG: pyridoxal-phosphate dependent enzyme [Anaerolineales bacterium]|nr:pyridoxal-phosphate dependent enzyme [Anaerolineales bacterium]